MSDLCRVLIVGNLSRDLERRVRADGITYGVTAICVGRTLLVGGYPVLETTRITVEVIGAARAASVAQQFGGGSQVLVEGHLELLAWAGTLLPLAMRPGTENVTSLGLILIIPGSVFATAAILSLGRSFGMEPAH